MANYANIDDYVAAAKLEVKPILNNIREELKRTVPDSQECISYNIPALKQKKVFIYFAAFKKHIGVYPPVKFDDALIKELQPYRNEKGNLSFPLSQPIPYALIAKVAQALSKEYSV